MSKYLILFLCLNSIYCYSCECSDYPNVRQRLERNDFVATVKINDFTPDVALKDKYIINIEVLTLYKGENVDEVHYYNIINSSCGFNLPIGSEWLIFASRMKQSDNLAFGACQGATRLFDKLLSEKINLDNSDYWKFNNVRNKKDLDLLNYISTNAIPVRSNKVKPFRLNIQQSDLKGFSNSNISGNTVSIFELSFDKNAVLVIKRSLIAMENKNVQNHLNLIIKKLESEPVEYHYQKSSSEAFKLLLYFYCLPETSKSKSKLTYDYL